MNAPAITPAQIVAAIASVLGLLVSFGFIDNETSKTLSVLASTFVPIALVIADAIIRHGRATAIGNGASVVGDKLLPPQ